jgi:hypothetical protein
MLNSNLRVQDNNGFPNSPIFNNCPQQAGKRKAEKSRKQPFTLSTE